MKRKLTVIVAALLCVLMAVPFAMMTSVADAVTVPTEPAYTGQTVHYVSFNSSVRSDLDFTINATTDGGDTASNPYKTNASGAWSNFFRTGKGKNGGTIVIVGKGLISESYTIPATTNPIVFTSKFTPNVQGYNEALDYASWNNDGTYNTAQSTGGQYGSIMLTGGKTLGIRGTVILDNIVVFNRSPESYGSGTIKVEGNIVVKDNVTFASLYGPIHNLEVAEGGYAYLHTLGFDAYTGKGTIVVGDEIMNTVTKADFAGFEGKIVDEDGNALFANETTETTAGETTETTAGETTETTAGETTETTAGDTTETTAETTDESANVPQKPTATNNKVVYIAYSKNLTLDITPSENGGATATDPYKTGQSDGWKKLMEGQAKDGGTLVLVGKGYIDTDYTIPATTSPLVITSGANKLYASKYQGTDADAPLYDVEKAGQYCTVNSSKAATAGQFGMFMFRTGKNITIAGEVIFDDAVILSRASTATDNPGSFTVANGGKLVINSNVDFVEMGGEVMYHLVVEEGGVAYLDKLGFDKYTGKGTLVINEALKAEAEPLLADFEGEVVFVKAATDGNGSTTTTAPTDNPTTGDLTLVVAVLAALSVATCISVVIVKKTKEN